MPTPFTHLHTAQRLLQDPQISDVTRCLLNAQRSAFLLGSIAADARISSGIKRSDTHFYQYDEPMRDHPWRVMLQRHESLRGKQDPAQRVFIAAYVAHLAMDELWTLELLHTQFWEREWGTFRDRFFALHILLTYMDEGDYPLLESWQAQALYAAPAENWLPFMSDADLLAWRDFIAVQLVEGSQTAALLSQRVDKTAQDFRAVLDSPRQMQRILWDHVPQAKLAEVEAKMYDFAREQMLLYLEAYP